MPSEIMLGLGEYRFCLDTAAYDELRRRTEYRWPCQDRINRAPALQFMGPGGETIELGGTIYPHFRGGLGQVDAMRAQAALGAPLLLVDGTGKVMGHWAIESIEETRRVFFADGTPRRIEFRLSIRRYNDAVRGA